MPELAMQAAENANLWHRRLGDLNCKSLSLQKKLDNKEVIFDGPVPDCDVSAVAKSHQLAHPKTADHKVKVPFQLVFADLMGPLTPEAFGGYKYIAKISDEYTKWTALFAEVLARHSQLISSIRTICGDSKWFPRRAVAVSYTHLTLPTIYSV